jgi:hypothetical protein
LINFKLPDFRTDHIEELKKYDFSLCAKDELVFFQVFKNPSFPNTYKICFNREDSRYNLGLINSGTGTPEPWQAYFEAVFIGYCDWVNEIYANLKKYGQGKDVYYIDDSEIDQIIQKESIALESKSHPDLYDGASGVVVIDSSASEMTDRVGFVYCMVHPRSNNQCKIGLSNRDPRVRAAELSIDTGLPESYKPIFILLTN